MSDDYFVVRVTAGWKLWIAPFIVLILCLVQSNLEIERLRSVNEFNMVYVSREIHWLQKELKRCQWSFRTAEYRRQELLGLRDEIEKPQDQWVIPGLVEEERRVTSPIIEE